MADWVTGKVTKVQNWTDALFSLTVHAPVHPFTAGQFTKLGLEIDGERVQRAYSYVNSPDNPDLEFYLVTVPDGKLSPRLAALKPGDEVQVVSEAAGFFVLDEVPDCETLWMLATGTAIGPYLSIQPLRHQCRNFRRFFNHIAYHPGDIAARRTEFETVFPQPRHLSGIHQTLRHRAVVDGINPHVALHQLVGPAARASA